MSILINKSTKIIVQGFTGKEATFHAQQCIEYGTQIVGGVTPFKGGQMHLDKPVFNTVSEAVRATNADTSIIFVPNFAAKDAIIEAADAGIRLAVVITEHTPVRDMLEAKAYAQKRGMRIVGPNCPGVITAGECKLGIMPGFAFEKGCVGLISKSGTLTYEAARQVCAAGLGISTAVGIGGDPVIGLSYIDLLGLFEQDEQTKIIVMIGEIGGSLETEAAKYIKESVSKPVLAFIAGASAPKGKRMGHAGAIIGNADESAAAKKEALRKCGIVVVDNPALIGESVLQVFKNGRV